MVAFAKKQLKVLLLYPPRDYFISSGLPHLVEEDIGFYKPLGLLYLAACVKQKTGHEVQVIDCQLEGLHAADIEKIVEREKPDVIGMTALTLVLYDVYLAALAVKRGHPESWVVVGGPHASIYPEETALLPGVDIAVPGEGEMVFVDLLECIAKGRDLQAVQGLCFEKNGYICNTGEREVVSDLDDVPFPDRRSVPYQKYFSLVDSDELSTTMVTSRGCPSQCIFCDIPHKTFRDRSAENIADEFEDILELGIREVYFYDDTFNLTRPRVINMCRELSRRDLPVRFAFRGRVKPLDEEMLDLLKEAGCERIQYGVEAGNDRILNILKKGVTVKEIQRAFDLTHKRGIKTVAYFMVGSPGER
ncbi:MAG: radical SAM protein, partial [Planctomycetota bacterium]|nr:radical SAM protein [Planctomycetota bacterium]